MAAYYIWLDQSVFQFMTGKKPTNPTLPLGELEFFSSLPEWDLERKAVLFLHPTFKSLDVHHAYHMCDLANPPSENSDTPLDYWRNPIFDPAPDPHSTGLETLRFHLSGLDPGALDKILSFPRSL